MNPYEPPVATREYAWIGRRIRRGFQFALAEYRRGIRQEGLTLPQHALAWASLLIFLAICLLEVFGLCTLVYFVVTEHQTWGIFFD